MVDVIEGVANSPPVFDDPLNVFNISENANDGDEIGTLLVSDDTGKLGAIIDSH